MFQLHLRKVQVDLIKSSILVCVSNTNAFESSWGMMECMMESNNPPLLIFLNPIFTGGYAIGYNVG